MIPHVLTIVVMLADGSIRETRVGVLANLPFCDLAGLGITHVLTEDNPALTAGWTCEPEGEEA